MGLLGSIATGSKILGGASVSFFAGSFGWAAVSGLIGGVLDSVGVVIPASTYLAASPFVGLAVAGYVVSEVLT
jgi:hypothetical protein